MAQLHGGNQVEKYDLNRESKLTFAHAPYHYSLYHLNGEQLFEGLSSASIFLLSKASSDNCEVVELRKELSQGDVLQLERKSVTLRAKQTTVLVVGVKNIHRQESLEHRLVSDIKKINKPWGHELLLCAEHPAYSFKEIFMNAGCRTSLQYHNQKRETYVLFHGRARLHYVTDPFDTLAEATKLPVSSIELEVGSVISITPRVIHRIEALTDVLLYEVSTPHLDDIVRVADDHQKPVGRISSENTTFN